MIAKTSIQKKTLGMLMLSACITGAGCGSASAMGRAPTTSTGSTPPAATTLPVAAPATQLGGDFTDGYQIGQRNGDILVDRLKQRTTDEQGCSAIGQLESALLAVTRTVRPPARGPRSNDQFVSGFYAGYVDTVRDTIHEVRQGCDALAYESGEFAGQLFGSVACQVQAVSVQALATLQLKPLHAGWSGGSSSVQSGCVASLTETLTSCSSGAGVSTELEAVLRVSCTDL